MIIQKINTSLLKNQNPVSVGIIDSGFSKMPKYAKLYGINSIPDYPHGNRILSIFSALDKDYPIPNLKLHLVCYNPKKEYEGLINALKLIPHVDILSISLSWRDDNPELKKLLFQKADKICVPFTKNKPDLIYPSVYEGVINCFNGENINADYSINPVKQYKGNSYAVPAIARLLAYNIDIKNDNNGMNIHELFRNYNNPFIQDAKIDENKTENSSTCKYCLRTIRTKNHTLVQQLPERCPYCGNRLRG